MEHGLDVCQLAGLIPHFVEQLVCLQVVMEAQWDQVPPFFRRPEAISDEDVLSVLLVKCVDQGAANKSGSAGNENLAFR